MIYIGEVLAGKDPLKAGFILIDHPVVYNKFVGPVMNIPGSLRIPAEGAQVAFVKLEGAAGSWEYGWIGELYNPSKLRRIKPEESDSSNGTDQTGFIPATNTGLASDSDDFGVHTIFRLNSPHDHHSIELAEQIIPALDGSGPPQEFLGVKLKTNDGKGIFLDDGQGKGKDGIKLYLDEGDPNSNIIQMSKEGDEKGIASESLTIVMNNNVEITSSKGNIAIAVATGEGGITIQNLGTGPVEIDSGGEVSVSAIGDISVVSTQGDISVASTQGDVNVEAGDGEDDSIDATISTGWAAKLSNVGASFATGDIEVPITSHPNVKINGKPAITK